MASIDSLTKDQVFADPVRKVQEQMLNQLYAIRK
jgi:hypothetical protein